MSIDVVAISKESADEILHRLTCACGLCAQAAAAAEADARNPVLRLRKLVAKQGGAGAADAVRALDVEGGLVGRMRALYEVRPMRCVVLL